MDAFSYRSGQLYAEGIPVRKLAREFGTPLYVYSRNHFRSQFRALSSAFRALKPLICYSVKANSNGAVIRSFLDEGSGLDIVSGGELYRALKAGADPSRIVFAGVGKTAEEIDYALKQDILFFTVESEPEAQRISERARKLRRRGRIAFRVNPDVDPKTHQYISTGKRENKFGLDLERIVAAYDMAARLPNLEIAGLHMHIGSQILTVAPFRSAVQKVARLCRELQSRYPTFRYVDIGGGVGIQYKPDQAPMDVTELARQVTPLLKRLGLSVVLEPGRFLVGNGAILVCETQYVKQGYLKKFVVVDAGMSELIRPALYQAHHEVLPVRATREKIRGDLVGPICESGDFLAVDRDLPAVAEGDLLALRSAGAYGFAMASNYNSRRRPAEVMVDGRRVALVRRRETWQDLIRGEKNHV